MTAERMLPAQVRETHSAVVILLGDRAYKVKKPVDLGFLDFRTRQSRERACHAELELNRRLAPDVYLGVADVLGPDGQPCDHLVVMRRMPDDRRLSALVAAGADVSAVVRHLARDVAVFHSHAATGPQISRAGSPEALTARWRSNIAGIREQAQTDPGLVDLDLVARVEHLALRYIEGRAELLTERAAAGLVRDGHGDLLADDIFCLDDGPRVLDCLDFDDELRWMDVLDDVACLAMDLERLGSAAAAQQLLVDYEEFSGEPAPASLRHHYVAYRALMRAKVTALRASEVTDPEQRSAILADVDRLVRLARQHCERGRVRCVLVGGPPASGKTTVAAGLAERMGAALLSADRVRKQAHGLDPRQHAPAAVDAGLYQEEATRRTYEELAALAGRLLVRGQSVVIDASCTWSWQRETLRQAAQAAVADLTELRCSAPTAVLQGRLRGRVQTPDALSDAGPAVGAALADRAEPWPTASVVDTGGRVQDAVEAAAAAIDG